MSDKIFIVSHAHARTPITVRGKNLEEALENEGLDPAIWHEIKPPGESEDDTSGHSQGDDRRKDD